MQSLPRGWPWPSTLGLACPRAIIVRAGPARLRGYCALPLRRCGEERHVLHCDGPSHAPFLRQRIGHALCARLALCAQRMLSCTSSKLCSASHPPPPPLENKNTCHERNSTHVSGTGRDGISREGYASGHKNVSGINGACENVWLFSAPKFASPTFASFQWIVGSAGQPLPWGGSLLLWGRGAGPPMPRGLNRDRRRREPPGPLPAPTCTPFPPPVPIMEIFPPGLLCRLGLLKWSVGNM